MTAGLLALLLATDGCEGCHAAQTETWAASRHAVSATNAVYLAALEREPARAAWCQGCHAPTGAPADGVTCRSCHGVADDAEAVLSARPSPAAPHPVRASSTLSSGKVCEGCHTFDFPNSRHRMQATTDEHQRSGSTLTCQACHLAPAVGHRMPGGHDADFLRRALSVTATRLEPDAVVVELTAGRVGHRVPTGDPFRRLRVALCQDEGCQHVEASFDLGRTVAPAGATWRITRDTTLEPGEVAVFRVHAPTSRFVRVSLHFGAVGTEARIPVEARSLEVLVQPVGAGTPAATP